MVRTAVNQVANQASDGYEATTRVRQFLTEQWKILGVTTVQWEILVRLQATLDVISHSAIFVALNCLSAMTCVALILGAISLSATLFALNFLSVMICVALILSATFLSATCLALTL